MDNPSSGDYIEVKKRKQTALFASLPQSSDYIANKQYLTIQTTAIADEDGNLAKADRYSIQLPSYDLATVHHPPRNVYPMFSMKK
jgi:hypothetical protein